MKKLLYLIVIAGAVMLCMPFIMYAQDSTAVAKAVNAAASVPNGTDSGIQLLVTLFGKSWPLVTAIGTILFVISEALASIPAVKSNSVFQLIQNCLKKLFGKK